jgi:hypothetical protein
VAVRHPSNARVGDETGEALCEFREETVWSVWVEEGEAAMVAWGFAAASRRERDQEMGRERIGRVRLGRGGEWP